jgi:multiple sugar transport system permease protein
MKLKNIMAKIIIFLLLVIISAAFSIPFLWMLTTSFKEPGQIWKIPPDLIPKPFVYKNYLEALKLMNFLLALKNSSIITGFNLIGVLLSCTIVSYGFARFKFPGRDFLFIVLLSTMMLPIHVRLIPQFLLFHSLGWINTFLPLIVPHFFGESFYIFLLRQFFLTLPPELDEAAKVDGANPLQILFYILLPLCKPALATIGVLQFMGSWNDFLGPLIYLFDESKFTLNLALANFRGIYYTYWNYLMVGAVCTALPCIILFFLAQKYFVQGIALTGMKG